MRRLQEQRTSSEHQSSRWAQCLLQAVTAVVALNDVSSWKALYALPKSVLRGQTRGGAKRHRGEIETKGLCRRWLEGQREQLWRQAREAKLRVPDNFHPDETTEGAEVSEGMRKRAIELTSIGLPGKACKALTKRPPAQVNPDIVEEMKNKHPTARAPIDWSELAWMKRACARP